MNSILIIITALIFYFLGRYAGREVEAVKKVKKELSRIINKTKAGPIDYATPEQVAFVGSEEEKIDNEAQRLLKENGFFK